MVKTKPSGEKLLTLITKVVAEGYDSDYQVIGLRMVSLKTGQSYQAGEVHVADFFRYEGMSDPEDNPILYVIETADGGKGTLIDGYGVYADSAVGNFMLGCSGCEQKIKK
jgi:hypothetical protein